MSPPKISNFQLLLPPVQGLMKACPSIMVIELMTGAQQIEKGGRKQGKKGREGEGEVVSTTSQCRGPQFEYWL